MLAQAIRNGGASRDFQIADENLSVLASDPTASLKVSMELSADFPSGASDQIKRAVVLVSPLQESPLSRHRGGRVKKPSATKINCLRHFPFLHIALDPNQMPLRLIRA